MLTSEIAIRSRSFDVIWQGPDRALHRVGRLTVDQAHDHAIIRSRFSYVPEALTVPGFRPFASFPELVPEREWVREAGLHAMFDNRMMSPRRTDFPRYTAALGLDEDPDPVEMLARTGGSRATDTIQLVPDYELDEQGRRTRLFLVSGVRHQDPEAVATSTLQPGDELRVHCDPENPYNPRALLLRAGTGAPVGFVPNFLLDDVHKNLDDAGVAVTVEHVNGPDAPAHLRLLARLVIRATDV